MGWEANIYSKNKQPDGSTGSAFWSGKAFWYHEQRSCVGYRLSWSLLHKARSCRLCLHYCDMEGEYTINIAVPWVCDLYWQWGRRSKRASWERSFAIHHWGLWLRLGGDPDGWTKGQPWWWHLHLDLPDFLLGHTRHTKQTLSRHTAAVYLPERAHPVTVELTFDTWTRPRWPFPQRRYRAKIEAVDSGGIPVPGKGTCAYNCGPDAIYSLGAVARTVEEAVAAMTESVLRDRNRYGGGDEYDPGPEPVSLAPEPETR